MKILRQLLLLRNHLKSLVLVLDHTPQLHAGFFGFPPSLQPTYSLFYVAVSVLQGHSETAMFPKPTSMRFRFGLIKEPNSQYLGRRLANS